MTYTTAVALAVLAGLALDLLVLRARLVTTGRWWTAYGIVLAFQLLANGWLTGRRIVTYDPRAILGDGSVGFLGAGRVAFAPVEDIGFGFALVLSTCALWVWQGRRGSQPGCGGRGSAGAAATSQDRRHRRGPGGP